MILVTVGTHERPFDRLVRAARDLRGEVVIQRGTSRVDVPGARVLDRCTPAELERYVDMARIVVTHGGPGSIRAALAAGKVPIVVPRQQRFGEHVDDHQVLFARRMRDRVHVVEDPRALVAAVEGHAERCSALEWPRVRDPREAARRLDTLVQSLFRRPP